MTAVNKYTIKVVIDSYAIKGITLLSAGDGMDFGDVNSVGSIALGNPSTIDRDSTNSTTTTSHTHELDADLVRRVLTPYYFQSSLPPETSSQAISFSAGVNRSITLDNSVISSRGFSAHPTLADTFIYNGDDTIMEISSGSAFVATDDRALFDFRLVRIRDSVESVVHYTLGRTISGVGADPCNYSLPAKIIEVLNGDSFRFDMESTHSCDVTFNANCTVLKENMNIL